MQQPDHDRLPPRVRSAVNRTMRHHDIRDPFPPERRIGPWAAVGIVCVIMLVTWAAVIGLVMLANRDQAGPGPVIIVTPSPYGPPASTGGTR